METLRYVAVLAVWILAAVPSHAAEIFFQGLPNSNRCGLHIEGEMRAGDSERLARLIANNPHKFIAAEFVFLNSPGGAVEEGLRIAKILEESGLTVGVGESAECGSACAIVYLSAPARMSAGSVLIHRPYFDMTEVHPSDYATYSGAQENYILQTRQYLSAKAIPSDLIDKMMALPSNDAYAMTSEDYRRVGLLSPMVEEVAIEKCHASNRDLADPSRVQNGFRCVTNEVLYPMRGAFLYKHLGGDVATKAIESAVKHDAQGGDFCPSRVHG